MYVRIRKLHKTSLKEGDANVMVATTKDPKGIIEVGPGVVEWWDGTTWKPVPIVNETDDGDPI